MKLLRVIMVFFSFIFLSNCISPSIQTVKETQGTLLKSMPAPMPLNDETWLSVGVLWNGIQYLSFSLRNNEKILHQQAVFHSLKNARIGEITSWYSRKRKVAGKVRIIHEFPSSDGYCRLYQSFIIVNGKGRHMNNKACKRLQLPWVFLK